MLNHVCVMRQGNMHEAQTQLSHLVEEIAAGDGFLICKAGKPMVRVTAIHPSEPHTTRSRRLGLLGSDAIADLFKGA